MSTRELIIPVRYQHQFGRTIPPYPLRPDSPAVQFIKLRFDRTYASVEAVHGVLDDCLCNTGEHPHILLLGWRTYLECAWNLSGGTEVIHLKEFHGVPVVCDPSRKSYAQAVEPLGLIGCSKGPFIWEPEKE